MENKVFDIEKMFLNMEPLQPSEVKVEVDPLVGDIITQQIKEEGECGDSVAMSILKAISGNMDGFVDYNIDADDYKPIKTDLTLVKAELGQQELVIKDEMNPYDQESNSLSDKEDDLPLIDRVNAVVGTSNTATGTERASSRSTQRRGKDSCLFCKKLVLNFARHIMRNHLSKYEVQEIYSYPANSLKRRQLLTALRKKGNYMRNAEACVKPVKKSRSGKTGEYLPCPKCLGFYTRKSMWRHVRACYGADCAPKAQVECQNFLVKDLEVDSQLQYRVFPVMRPDNVSLVAKKDRLICAFGAHYLNSHQHERFLNITSRKMRELSKLLTEMQRLQPSIGDLLDCLKTRNFDLIVAATKRVSGYDEQKQTYATPTAALNIGASLRRCCHLALDLLVNREDRTQAQDLSSLIEDHWKGNVSRCANEALYQKRAEKLRDPSAEHLAGDLKLLIDCLCKIAEEKGSKLTSPSRRNVEAYNDLLESVYCRAMLFNRVHYKEVSRMLLSDYDDIPVGRQLNAASWITEMILEKTCKSVQFSANKGSPFLFSPDVQKDIEVLKSVRNIHVLEDNEYLFGKANSQEHLAGCRVIQKYAKLCGVENPKVFASSRFNKTIATLAQVFSMSDSDIEELADCIGLEGPVRKYEIKQVAKMTELLSLIDDGEAEDYKGKSLEEIEVGTKKDKEVPGRDTPPTPKPKGRRKRVMHVPWLPQQKDAVIKHFSNHIRSKKPPKRHECDLVKDLYPELLRNKDWLKIKVFIQNVYTKKCEISRYKEIVSGI